MAHSIGIHLGERRYHLVALDGSLKKHKVVAALSGEIPSGEGAGQAVVDELREHVKTHKLQVESVHLAIASGVAAFRNLTLPFLGECAIVNEGGAVPQAQGRNR
jgi:Tfp pilus assembly PilM family ATPase